MHRGRVRPDPVSCQSCRSKKLKCNRIQPCSNCTARRITCSFLVPPQEQTNSQQSNAAIIERLERLEAIVLKGASTVESHRGNPPDENHAARQNLSKSDAFLLSENIQNRDRDSQFLESIGTRDDSLLHRLSNGLAIRVLTTHEIISTQTHPQRLESSNIEQLNNACLTFPSYKIAALLFQTYESTVDHLCRILHIPTVWSLVTTVYLQINDSNKISPGLAALLLSIFAIAAYFYKPYGTSEIASTKKNAIHLSKAFSKCALDALDYSRRNTSGTLEDVQAHILMSFVSYHLDGFSSRGRLLSTTATALARELRLHQLDAENELSTAGHQFNVRSMIDREVKRRVFWHIASTDWLFSAVSGPQEGMYFVHSNQVCVDLPKDCTDDELVLGEIPESTQGLRPTGMAFFLQRLKLAHLCREITDTIPLATCKLMQMPYEQVITLDQKLLDFISALPFFYKLDAESRARSRPLESIYSMIPVSRHCIIMEAHSRRCKLHQRFLLRKSVNAQYSYSRLACLESARAIIQAYQDFQAHESISTVPELMGIVVHFTFLGLVVMAMDLCFNRDEADKEEVKAALRVYKTSGSDLPLQAQFLISLRSVLRKHNVQLHESHVPANPVNGFSQEMMLNTSIESTYDEQIGHVRYEREMFDPNIGLDASFDEFWQSAMQGELNPDLLTWDKLFSSLDSRPL